MGLIDWFLKKSKFMRREFAQIKKAFEERDKKISEKAEKKELDEFKELMKQQIEEIKAELRSKVRAELRSEVRTKPAYEERILQRAKRTRPELIKQVILQLLEKDMRTLEIENIIVREKQLCGKTQFYHYLGLLRTELRSGVRTELKQKIK